MELSLQGLAAIWVGKARRPRPGSVAPAPTCESLEDRQLLSMAGLPRNGLATTFTQRAYPAQFYGAGTSAVASPDAAHAGQGLGLGGRRLHLAGHGAPGMRNALRLARLQGVAGGLSAMPAAFTTTVPTSPSQTSATPPVNQDATGPAVAAAVSTQSVAAVPVPAGATAVAPGNPATMGWFAGKSGKGAAAVDDAAGQAFDKLRTDLQAIHDKSEVTPKQLAAVRNDVKAIDAAATSEAGQDALKTFTADVQALDGQLPTDAQRDQLVAEFTAVLKSRGISDQGVIDRTVADVQAVAQSAHITADDLATIAADRKAIATAMGNDAQAPAVPKDVLFGEPTRMLLAGLTGGGAAGVPMDGGPFEMAVRGDRFGGPMGSGRFTVSMNSGPLGGPMGGGSVGNVMTYGGPMMGRGPMSGRWGF